MLSIEHDAPISSSEPFQPTQESSLTNGPHRPADVTSRTESPDLHLPQRDVSAVLASDLDIPKIAPSAELRGKEPKKRKRNRRQMFKGDKSSTADVHSVTTQGQDKDSTPKPAEVPVLKRKRSPSVHNPGEPFSQSKYSPDTKGNIATAGSMAAVHNRASLPASAPTTPATVKTTFTQPAGSYDSGRPKSLVSLMAFMEAEDKAELKREEAQRARLPALGPAKQVNSIFELSDSTSSSDDDSSDEDQPSESRKPRPVIEDPPLPDPTIRDHSPSEASSVDTDDLSIGDGRFPRW